jgi:hypothetical protein
VMSAGDRIAGMSGDHDHDHPHPGSPPVVSTEGAKKLDAPALLSTAVELASSGATLEWRLDTAVGHAVRRAASVLGPRAPPIS